MAYTKQTWTDGDAATPVNASRLGHIETGVDDAHDLIADHETRIDTIETTGLALGTLPAGSIVFMDFAGPGEPTRPSVAAGVKVWWTGPFFPAAALVGDKIDLTA
jgi:hypothetical protein